MADGNSLFKVSIDFSQSHLFFPNIIHWILLILAVLIALTSGPKLLRQMREKKKDDKQTGAPTDWVRLLGTLVLTIIYFSLMETVGDLFPNTGFGFLFTSIPFMFLLSVLFVHQPGRREFVTITLSSIISPAVAWYVLAQMFNITLP
ncbi:tripartite tricarboxylate transporter TctB family protein [Cohaesibacter haloalkalitolerans]|uniref:tripartite tricarboxylate transporter TctB family protein n=1 Tax=Cohaesibacter haloalkalitolerans TaxID=1162980 RepID=UPI000E6539AD|nr:tripartite tricarboxylate transporter TctB family protein [Cohaesibacter haloalkalitolerans]